MTGGPETATPPSARDLIRRLPLFSELADAELDRLCRMARRVRYPAGATVMKEGTPGDGLYVVVEGELDVITGPRDRELLLARRGPGEVLGEMSLLEQAPHSATVRAARESEVIVILPRAFHRLLADSPDTASRVLKTMAGRLRSTEASLMAREKLASLGTLAAGLAHELNNPAAAIRRATSQLRDTAQDWRRRSAELGRLRLEPEQAERLRTLEAEAAAEGSVTPVGALETAAAEERLAEWLRGRGVPDPSAAAAAFVGAGWSLERVEPLAGEFDAEALRVVLAWLASTLAARELLAEIELSAATISDIVAATKSYAYLDRAPVQDVDLEETLEATLTILRHQLKGGIDVARDYAGLPPIEGFGSELTQVWTNLIDNAIDAMDGEGVLEIRTRADAGDPDRVVVEIVDSGPGIPGPVRARMFEPFFTTKPPGQGSGLGLHIAHDIVVKRHGGRIDVDSRPGRTAFRIRLPRRLRRS